MILYRQRVQVGAPASGIIVFCEMMDLVGIVGWMVE